MTRRNAITPEHKQQVIAMFTQRKAHGWNQKIIAQTLGISERSVKRILDEAGLATAVPLIKGEAHLAIKMLQKHNLNADGADALITQAKQGPTRGQIVKAIVDMDEATWGAILKEIVIGRVAKNSNNMVATAMLNISNAVDKNAKPGNN